MRLSNAPLNIDNDVTVKTLEHYFLRLLRPSIRLDGCHPSQFRIKQSCKDCGNNSCSGTKGFLQTLHLNGKLSKDVQLVKDMKIPRFLLVDSDNQFHLFGFSDASEKAYAAAIYCHFVSDKGKINVQLITAKTRIAPLKPVSLPRLELRSSSFS
ncbi:hypothetical protein TNCV_4598461 [Trichonephila clavipes]|nr:hypothetical protein TNCV_4598461 [Trichonephila clavipes]